MTYPADRVAGGPRWPDFVVIGAMKSGTTSLYKWLGGHPDVWLPRLKEPHYFARPDAWARGEGWYLSLFAPSPTRAVTGEFSVSYTSPGVAAVAAARMAAVLPHVRLVYLLREPRARLRSHYVHEVRRTRERRSFAEAVAAVDSVYVAQSEYGRCLKPYLELFAASQVLVVTLEDLAGPSDATWLALLAHLGVSAGHPRGEATNVTAQKSQFTRPMLWMHEHGVTRLLDAAPAPLRRAGRRLVLREPAAYRAAVAQARSTPLPAAVEERLGADAERLRQLLGPAAPCWRRDPAPTEGTESVPSPTHES